MTTTARANPYSPATVPLPEITVTGRLDRLRAAFSDHEIGRASCRERVFVGV